MNTIIQIIKTSKMYLETSIITKQTVLPIIDLRKCSGCNKCVVACPNNVLSLKDLNKEQNQSRFFKWKKIRAVVTNGDNCTSCQECAYVCKHRAISFN